MLEEIRPNQLEMMQQQRRSARRERLNRGNKSSPYKSNYKPGQREKSSAFPVAPKLQCTIQPPHFAVCDGLEKSKNAWHAVATFEAGTRGLRMMQAEPHVRLQQNRDYPITNFLTPGLDP